MSRHSVSILPKPLSQEGLLNRLGEFGGGGKEIPLVSPDQLTRAE